MAKTKKISINAFEKVMKETENTAVFDWHGIEITITKVLPLKEMLSFVDYVVNACIGDDGSYYPEVRDFAFNVAVLEKYANFTTPKNVEFAYDLIYRTDAVLCVLAHIDEWQIEEIHSAIERKIDYKLRANTDALHAQMEELYSVLADITGKMEDTFLGVNPEDFGKLAKAIEGGEIDEKKIADAWIENFKANLGE